MLLGFLPGLTVMDPLVAEIKFGSEYVQLLTVLVMVLAI